MPPTIEHFWHEIQSHPDLLATRHEWARLLGSAFDSCERFLVPTRELATSWECGLSGKVGCFRQVIEHARDRIVAVCTDGQCAKVSLRREELILHRLDIMRVARELCNAIGMDGRDVRAVEGETGPAGQPYALRLGSRMFGGESVAFYFTRHIVNGRLLPLIEKIRLRDPVVCTVLFVPQEHDIELVVREVCRGKDVAIMPLDKTVTASKGHRLEIDLADFVIAHRFAELNPVPFLWPRYWLVLDPREDRYWYGGRPIAFPSRSRRTQGLLMALARTPGVTVPRKDICSSVWPDEYGGRAMVEVDWDRRIRDLKLRLSLLLKQTSDIAPRIPADPIKATAGSEIDGGYVLDIPSTRILWWSELDA